MSQRNQYPTSLLHDIISEQQQLSQHQQNMLDTMYNSSSSSNHDLREWSTLENQKLRQALTNTNEADHNSNEAYQNWLKKVSKIIETKTPEEIAKKIYTLRKQQQQQQFTMSQKQIPQFQEGGNSAQVSPTNSSDSKKRKRIDREPTPTQDKERKRVKSHGNRQRLLELVGLTDEDKSEQQEDIMGNILEENQEIIVAIRGNINKGNAEANEPLIKDFKANIAAILKTMENMKGIMAHMNPIDELISGIDWES